LAARAAADHRFRVVAPHPLNLVCIAHVDGNEATDRLVERANSTGQALFTRTVLDGASALRISVGGARTEARHVDSAWALLQSLA
jgi:aromatic-L-amino-acid decarboxylase